MFLATSNQSKRLLCLSYNQRVRAEELKRGREDVKMLLANLPPGFRLLVDLSQLETMDLDCMKEIGRAMELFDRSGVGMVVRVIPNPDKDNGLNILTIFHYPHHPQVVTCQTMTEAAGLLGL
jgi:anti-anti-sigma regulatory factor